jgi:hypothetical protein
MLCRWDIAAGGEPRKAGLLGRPGRVISTVSELVMDSKNDVLHFADTNYMEDAAHVLAVDLKTVERDWDLPRVVADDVHPYMLFTDAATIHSDPQFAEKSDKLHHFADTAALIANLDLVISVDTVVAHVAGALAKPVWILLPFAPDWRWGLGQNTTPWYPSATLYRQPVAGDWRSVLARVADDVKALT